MSGFWDHQAVGSHCHAAWQLALPHSSCSMPCAPTPLQECKKQGHLKRRPCMQ